MRYIVFRDQIREALRQCPQGLTWKQLRERLDLPYRQPCPEWTRCLQEEIGLVRNRKAGNALVWELKKY